MSTSILYKINVKLDNVFEINVNFDYNNMDASLK